MENLQELYSKAKEWLKAHRKFLRKYRGEWIAYNGEVGIITHDKDATKVMRAADESGMWHIIKYLHPYVYGGLRRLVPVHFRPLHLEVWEPNMMVSIHVRERSKQLEMLVDSGADISTITLQVGEELGLERLREEVPDVAEGVNGIVEYVLRNVQINLGFAQKQNARFFLNT